MDNKLGRTQRQRSDDYLLYGNQWDYIRAAGVVSLRLDLIKVDTVYNHKNNIYITLDMEECIKKESLEGEKNLYQLEKNKKKYVSFLC